MSRLTDEQRDFMNDSREKKRIAWGSRNKRSHCGKSGGIRFPSDSLTKKERAAMDGEVITYQLSEVLTDEEFNRLPDDIKKLYIDWHSGKEK